MCGKNLGASLLIHSQESKIVRFLQLPSQSFSFCASLGSYGLLSLDGIVVPSLPCIRYSDIYDRMGSQVFASRPQSAQKVDSAIHRINLYPLDSAIGFHNTYLIYPLDSALSGG